MTAAGSGSGITIEQTLSGDVYVPGNVPRDIEVDQSILSTGQVLIEGYLSSTGAAGFMRSRCHETPAKSEDVVLSIGDAVSGVRF